MNLKQRLCVYSWIIHQINIGHSLPLLPFNTQHKYLLPSFSDTFRTYIRHLLTKNATSNKKVTRIWDAAYKYYGIIDQHVPLFFKMYFGITFSGPRYSFAFFKIGQIVIIKFGIKIVRNLILFFCFYLIITKYFRIVWKFNIIF